MDRPHRPPDRLDGGGEIPLEDQQRFEAEHLAKQNKLAGRAGTAYSGKSQLFAAIRANNKDRVRELLETGANANAWESPPWWMFAGTVAMPFILLCAFTAPQHYSKQALHIAMIEGDPDMVKLLLDFNADPKAPAVFWNCCYCCTWRATSASFQEPWMGGGAVNGDPVPAPQQEAIKRLIEG
jgi:hypothetical protein